MRFFSTFSGIGGFEIGIHNAYRSTIGRSEADPSGNEAQGLFTEKGQNSSTKKGRISERTSDITHERSLRLGDKSSAEIEQNGQGRNGTARKEGADVHGGPQPPLCVGFSEINEPAISVYQKQFGGTNYGDITKINADELPDFDCLVGGFPCQAFSIAGKRHGFNDTRGTLFFDLARILRAKRPRLFVFENVKGLLSHDDGNTFRTIIATIDELGYDCQWQIINSKNHGVPQNRERVYIVGHLRGTPRPEVFPLGQYDIKDSRLSGHVSNTLTARYEGAQAVGTYIVESELNAQGLKQLNQPVHSNNRIYAPDGISPTLNTMQGGRRQPFVALSRDEADSGSAADTVGVREASGLSGQLDEVRAVSDTQRYKMAGNAVTTNVVQAIFERIFGGGYER